MRTIIRTSLVAWAFLALAGMIAEPAFGQAAGRVVAEVVDSEGNPIQGAQVTVTTQALDDFEDTYKTNKKGRFTAVVIDATKIYDIRVEADGFRPHETQVKPTPGDIVRSEIVLYRPDEQGAPQGEGQGMEQASSRGLTDAQKAYNAGVEATQAGDEQMALTKFQEAADLDPELTQAHQARASLYLQQSDFAKAAEAAEMVLAQDPEDTRALEIAFDAYENLGEEEKAEEYLRRLTEIGGGNLGPRYFNAGVAALNMGDQQEARAKFEEALAEDATLVPAWAALAVVRLQLEDVEGALEAANKALELDPENDRAQRMRYQALRFLERDEEAQAAFDALSETDRAEALKLQYNEATEFFNAGETQKAMVLFGDVLAADPDHAKAHYMMGLSYVNLGENAKAKEHFNRFLELAPDDPDATTAKEMLAYL